jgi:hypothetical protein
MIILSFCLLLCSKSPHLRFDTSTNEASHWTKTIRKFQSLLTFRTYHSKFILMLSSSRSFKYTLFEEVSPPKFCIGLYSLFHPP